MLLSDELVDDLIASFGVSLLLYQDLLKDTIAADKLKIMKTNHTAAFRLSKHGKIQCHSLVFMHMVTSE